MVIHRHSEPVEHTRFDQLASFLRPNDLLVFNSSRTIPAVLQGCETASTPCLEVRLAHRLPDNSWLALLLCQGEELFACHMHSGMRLNLGEDLTATITGKDTRIPRLWQLRLSHSGTELLDRL